MVVQMREVQVCWPTTCEHPFSMHCASPHYCICWDLLESVPLQRAMPEA